MDEQAKQNLIEEILAYMGPMADGFRGNDAVGLDTLMQVLKKTVPDSYFYKYALEKYERIIKVIKKRLLRDLIECLILDHPDGVNIIIPADKFFDIYHAHGEVVDPATLATYVIERHKTQQGEYWEADKVDTSMVDGLVKSFIFYEDNDRKLKND